MSGVDTLLVSNDQFRDHLHHVASSHPTMIQLLLKQWQLGMGSQVKMLFKNGSLFALVVSDLRNKKLNTLYNIAIANQVKPTVILAILTLFA